ncbi:hypothetical protein AWB78_05865 [Caballeronia calidae]|uniref:Uncharacterized protein n=1 Tax=Caballeronia calidae TaxID=1777139 RepID=A0A158E0K9_9BURK|nr:hypothetical protein [Caballeronia calidae]SAK99986.1 hypothetical protein AWB78_05865 [Caballeronia calidae]
MSKPFHPPRHALTFMATAGRMATRYGLKKGLSRAAAKANPVLMVIEAAASVAEAVQSYLTLREAQAHRDGLRELIPHEAERLRLEREALKTQIDNARAELDSRIEVQKRIGELVLTCSAAVSTAWSELNAIRSADLPDIEAFDRKLDELDAANQQFRHAIAIYQDDVECRQTGEQR